MKFFLLFYTFCFPILFADIIFFNNEDRLSGEIWKESSQNILLISEIGNYKINRKLIKKIDYSGKTKYRMGLVGGNSLIIVPILSEPNNLEYYEVNEDSTFGNKKWMSWSKIIYLRILK